jgi:hypothetical protein
MRCGKHVFETRSKALDGLRSLHQKKNGKAKRMHEVGPLNVYLCRDCDGWHVGHLIRRGKVER